MLGRKKGKQRFNPAPGWPQPPVGWSPGSEWTPDSSWPPAPDGWQLWIDAEPLEALKPAARFNTPPGWPEPPEGWLPGPNWIPDPSWPAPPIGWELVTATLTSEPSIANATSRTQQPDVSSARAVEDNQLESARQVPETSDTPEHSPAALKPGPEHGALAAQAADDMPNRPAGAIRGRTWPLKVTAPVPSPPLPPSGIFPRDHQWVHESSGVPDVATTPEVGGEAVQESTEITAARAATGPTGEGWRRRRGSAGPEQPGAVGEVSAIAHSEVSPLRQGASPPSQDVMGTGAGFEGGTTRAAQPRGDQQVELREGEPETPDHQMIAQVEDSIASLQTAEAAVEQARRQIKLISERAAPAFKALANASTPERLMSIGAARRVVLFDRLLQLPGQRIPLGPGVSATANDQGNHQVLRGRTLVTGARRTADRRQMSLQVTWPGGHEVVYWERNEDKLTGSWVTPREVHAMAGAINAAVQRYPGIAADIHGRRAAATAALKAVTAPLHDEVEALLANLERHAEECAAASSFASAAQDRDGLGRKERGQLKNLQSKATKGERAVREAVTKGRKLDAELMPWLDLAKLDHGGPAGIGKRGGPATGSVSAERGPVALQPLAVDMGRLLERREAGGAETAPAPAGGIAPPAAVTAESLSPTPMQLLRELAELRDSGVLTEQEFTAKKAEVLARL